MTRLAVLASGGGSLTAGVLAAVAAGELAADVVGIFSDRADAGVLDVASISGTPSAVVTPHSYPDRTAWNRALADTVQALNPDWVISLGFMRLLGPVFLHRFPNRIINTHPALLPAFPGAHAVRDALTYGVRVTGCTVHLVDSGVDTGPVIAQAPVDVHDDDDEHSLHARIKAAERGLVVEVLIAVSAGDEFCGPPGQRVRQAIARSNG